MHNNTFILHQLRLILKVFCSTLAYLKYSEYIVYTDVGWTMWIHVYIKLYVNYKPPLFLNVLE